MRFLFAILLFAAGGIFCLLIPGFGMSENPAGENPSAGPAESHPGQPAGNPVQPVTSRQSAISSRHPAEAAVESAIRAAATFPALIATDSPDALADGIAINAGTVVTRIKAVITPDGFDPRRANEIVDRAAIADIQKATLKRLIETTRNNPDLLRSALGRAEMLLQ